MATIIRLSDRIDVNVYYGGKERSRCYDFHDRETGGFKLITEEALVRLIAAAVHRDEREGDVICDG